MGFFVGNNNNRWEEKRMKKRVTVLLILSLIANFYLGWRTVNLQAVAKEIKNTEEVAKAPNKGAYENKTEEMNATTNVEKTSNAVVQEEKNGAVENRDRKENNSNLSASELEEMEKTALRLLVQFYMPLVNVVTEDDSLKVINLPSRQEMLEYYAYEISDKDLAKKYIYRLFEEKEGNLYYVPQKNKIMWFQKNLPYSFQVLSNTKMKIMQTVENGTKMTFVITKTDKWKITNVIED